MLRFFILEKGDPVTYRPFNAVMYLIDGRLWGFNPTGFHLSNLFLHLANVVMAYILGRLLLGSRKGATALAAFFLLSPLQPEAVTWVSGRSGPIATFFYLACLIFYWQYRTRGRSYFLFLSVISGFLGILGKELALTFPLMLFLMDLVFFQEQGKRSIRAFPPVLFVLLFSLPLFFGIRLFLLWDILPIILNLFSKGAPDLSPPLIAAGLIYRVLVNVTVNPFRVMMDPFHANEVYPEWLPSLYGLICLALFVFGIRAGTWRNRVAVFSAVGFAASLLPVSLFFNVVPGGNLVSSRFLYTPSLFAYLYLANLAFGQAKRAPGRRGLQALYLLTVILCLVMTVGLKQNNRPWIEASRISGQIMSEFRRISPQIPSSARIFMEGLPDNHRGAFIFPLGTIGVAHAINLAAGQLQPHFYAPDMNKSTYEIYYTSEILPLKLATPEMIHSWFWEISKEILEVQQIQIPPWMTDNPDDYDYHIRWQPLSGTFQFEADDTAVHLK